MPVHITTKSSAEKEAEKAAAEAIKAKAGHLFDEWVQITAKLKQNWDAMQDVVAAARVFNVRLEFLSNYPSQPPATRYLSSNPTLQPPGPASPQQSLFETPMDGSIRDMVLDQLKEAGEKGTKAAAIRAYIEKKLGRALHYKTVGMTLYRLSERNQARREGFIWFYVPQKEAETKTPA